jgi:hypothetical protein
MTIPPEFPASDNPYAAPNEVAASPDSSFGPSHLVAGISILIFACSLPFDGYYIARDGLDKADPAWGLLLIGWLGVGETLAWFANPMLLGSWVLVWVKQGRVACVTALLATAFSLSFLLNKDIICNEGGGRSPIIGYGYGYWLWIASIVVALVSAFGSMLETPAVAKHVTAEKTSEDRQWWLDYRKKVKREKSAGS